MNPTWVGQEHANGCGPATVAMILGIPYAEACARLQEHVSTSHGGDWEKSGVSHMTLDAILGEDGYFIRLRYKAWHPEGWPLEPFAPVHYASVAQPSGNSHFVVLRDDGFVLDPLRAGLYRLADWPDVNYIAGLSR